MSIPWRCHTATTKKHYYSLKPQRKTRGFLAQLTPSPCTERPQVLRPSTHCCTHFSYAMPISITRRLSRINSTPLSGRKLYTLTIAIRKTVPTCSRLVVAPPLADPGYGGGVTFGGYCAVKWFGVTRASDSRLPR